MGVLLIPGRFYQFHRERVISRAGQPIATVVGVEIGPEISKEDAFREVRSGLDIYTPSKQDAYKLARHLHPGTPVLHDPNYPYYYPHFHASGAHLVIDYGRPGRPKAISGSGHIFFGERGQQT